MRQSRSSSKSGLFLMELIIAITFFSVASAICIQLFVHAHLLGVQSTDLNNAMTLAQNRAEEFKAMPGAVRQELLDEKYREEYYSVGEDGHLIYLGERPLEDTKYCVRTHHGTLSQLFHTVDIQVMKMEGERPKGEEPLYAITVGSYEGA